MQTKSFLLPGAVVLLALGTAASPSSAGTLAQVTLYNQTVLGQPDPAVAVNALSNAPPSGSVATAGVLNGNSVESVALAPGAVPQLAPVGQALEVLNPPIRTVVGAAAGAVASATAGLTAALAPVTNVLMTLNPPINSLLHSLTGGLSGVTSGNMALVPGSLVGSAPAIAPASLLSGH